MRWDRRELVPYDHPYNTTIDNERCVELAIALPWLSERRGLGLEVGNVTSHYRPARHRIVDLHEHGDGVDNIDLFDIDGTYDWVLSISTIEHIHWDDRHDPTGAFRAVEHLRRLLRPGGRLLVTVPLGWNPSLDDELPLGADVWRCYWRNGNDWSPGPLGAATYGPRWANAVWIGEWTP